MTPARRLLAAALGLLGAVASAGESGPGAVRVLSAPIPNALLRQGEVRVFEDGDRVWIQTVLHTRFPERVIRAICEKEARNWPPEREGNRDSRAYCEALRAWMPELAAGPGPAQWTIEFSAGPAGAALRLSAPGEGGGERGIERPAPAVSATYIRGNMTAILQDQFGQGRDRETAMRLIRRLETPP